MMSCRFDNGRRYLGPRCRCAGVGPELAFSPPESPLAARFHRKVAQIDISLRSGPPPPEGPHGWPFPPRWRASGGHQSPSTTGCRAQMRNRARPGQPDSRPATSRSSAAHRELPICGRARRDEVGPRRGPQSALAGRAATSAARSIARSVSAAMLTIIPRMWLSTTSRSSFIRSGWIGTRAKISSKVALGMS